MLVQLRVCFVLPVLRPWVSLGQLLECERKWECLVECVQRRGVIEAV